MQDKIIEIASRVKELRDLSGFTVSEMADLVKVSEDRYKNFEEGLEDIPASILLEISHKLKVDMSLLLTGEDPKLNIFTVTRKGTGVSVERRKQYKYQSLAYNFIHKKVEPFIVTVEPKPAGTVINTNSHPGQEFNLILEGRLKMYIHKNEVILEEGDSIYFDSNYEHAMEALGDNPAKFLAIIM